MCYGLTVHAVCDADCKCIYLNVSCPGSVNDALAYSECYLSKVVEKLPIGIFVIGDNALVNTCFLHSVAPNASASIVMRLTFSSASYVLKLSASLVL